jgi:hypothetical protein
MGANQTAADHGSMRVAQGCDEADANPDRRGILPEGRSEMPIHELAQSWANAGTASAQMQQEIVTELQSSGMSLGIADGMARQVSSLLCLLSLRDSTLPQTNRRASKGSGPEANGAAGTNVIGWNAGLGASLGALSKRLVGEVSGVGRAAGSEAASTRLAECIVTVSSLIRRPAGLERRYAQGAGSFGPGAQEPEVRVRREGNR